MSLCRRAGLDGIAWSLRRLHTPVSRDALVLEVGSGGNPYWRSNVLLDAYLDTRERHFEQLVHDRPTVLGFVERLPFRDDVFDFVIASHVLEHSPDPVKFLGELQRVARAGYIEVPDAFTERLTAYLDHRLEITERDGTLVIRKKSSYITDAELWELFTHRANRVFPELMSRRPFDFHVRFYWSRAEGDGIPYRITNPEVQCDWKAVDTGYVRGDLSMMARAKRRTLSVARRLFSQHRRNRSLDLVGLLRCPECSGAPLSAGAMMLTCPSCGRAYPIVAGGVPDFTVRDPE